MAREKSSDDRFSIWRNSYKKLRAMESDLVSQARSGEDPVVIARLYEKVEALRMQTSELFQVAQTASMAHQIPISRLAALRLEPTPSEFGALHGG